MTRSRVASGIGLLLVCAGASGALSVRGRQATFRARTDLVSVTVSVTRGREAVVGLTPADFELSDNGVRQTVDAVSLDRVPLDLTLLMTAYPAARTDEHSRGMISADATRRLLLPGDRLRVVWANDDIRGGLVDSNYSLAADPGYREIMPGVAHGDGVGLTAGSFQKSGFGVALADGLFYALAWPVAPDRRHLVVAFTDGWDTASTLDMKTLPALAGHSEATLHAVFWVTPGEDARTGGGVNYIGPLSPGMVRVWEESYRLVDSVVQRTGGTLQRSSHAADALAAVVADFRSSYVLHYTPRGVPASGWHEIQVRVTRPGSFKIRARKGYEGTRVDFPVIPSTK